MEHPVNLCRRELMRQLAFGLSLAPALAARIGSAADTDTNAPAAGVSAATGTLISEDDPAAKAVHYVADASRAQGAPSGADCANCSLYGGSSGSVQGPCSIFPGRLVKAAGWCSSWSTL